MTVDDANTANRCLICGAETYGVHCKVLCPNCGYREDCSDLFPVDDGSGERVRPAEAEDTEQVLALIGGVFREYGCVLDAKNEDTHLLRPGPYFREHGGEFWVVTRGTHVIATIGIVLHPDAGELRCLYVHRNARRCGLGRRLSEMAIEYARHRGRTRVFLWSDTRFGHAHQLYRAMGFHQTGSRELHDSNDTSEIGFDLRM